MQRYSMKRIAILAGMSVFAGAAIESAQAYAGDAARPNILWITVEDISPHLGCYGDAHADTPTLDRLAEQGTRFTHAFATAGVCAPARSCIITGVYPTSLGSHHMRCTGRLPEGVKYFPQYLRDAGYYCTNNSKTDYNLPAASSAWHESSGRAHWRNRSDSDQPFFAVFNLHTTHESRIENDRLYEQATKSLPDELRHDPQSLALPPYYPDTAAVRSDWARNYDLIAAMDRQVAEILGELAADGLAEETIVFWFSDHGVGLPRAKRWLYDSGIHVPMIVRIPETFRNGGQGAPATVVDDLVSFVDLAPTVLNLAGVEIPAHMQGRAFLGKNLSPPREYLFAARDRMDERYDIIRAVRDKRYKYIRNYEPFKTYYQYMNTPEKGAVMRELRRLHARGELPPAAEQFMAESKPLEELYDLASDPHELNNLVGSPEHRQTLQRMRAAHIGWVEQTIDVGLVPEPEIRALERAKDAGIYDAVRQTDLLPIRDIRRAAALGDKGDDALGELGDALTHQSPAVRYWGAIGLGNLGAAASQQAPALAKSLRDPSPSVRIAAARAVAKIGDVEPALEVLKGELASPQEWVRLNAAIVLDEMGESARPAVSALRQALDDQENKYVVRVANHALNKLLGESNQVP